MGNSSPADRLYSSSCPYGELAPAPIPRALAPRGGGVLDLPAAGAALAQAKRTPGPIQGDGAASEPSGSSGLGGVGCRGEKNKESALDCRRGTGSATREEWAPAKAGEPGDGAQATKAAVEAGS